MKLEIKLIILLVCLLGIVGLGVFTYSQHRQIVNLKEDLAITTNNNMAYAEENAALNGKVIEFQLTAGQLANSRDSLIEKLNSARKSLNIKDKRLRDLQYLASVNHKVDTIIVMDTIFRKGVILDTSLVDNWSALKLHAEYPNIISTDYSFKNSTIVVTHESRVTVDPPKKCWLARLFQKKQTIVEIDVVQENPYCENKEQKFIKVIKK